MSKPRPKFKGKIKDGKVVLNDSYSYNRWLKINFKEDSEVNISVAQFRKCRTTGQDNEKGNQNGYYWAVVLPLICESTGYSQDEMHESMKAKFLRVAGDDQLPIFKGSAKLNTVEWEDWMTQIRVWAADYLKVQIPLPDNIGWDDESN